MKQVNPSLHLQNGSATKEHDLPCTIQQLRGGVCEDLRWPDDVLAEMGQISPNQFISWELHFCLNTGYKHYKHITHKHYNLEMLPQGHVSIENKDAHNTNIKIEEGNCYRNGETLTATLYVIIFTCGKQSSLPTLRTGNHYSHLTEDMGSYSAAWKRSCA